MARLAMWVSTIYVFVWLILVSVLTIAYADRSISDRNLGFTEYLWDEYQILSIIFFVMVILLPFVLAWTFYEEWKGSEASYIVKPYVNGSYLIERLRTEEKKGESSCD